MSEYTRQLLAAQWDFSVKISKLILWANQMGYQTTKGDAFRDPRCPYGSKSSRHRERLAEDINLFINGIYCDDTESHTPLGEQWEKMGGIWGGRFASKDGNHYEWPFKYEPEKT